MGILTPLEIQQGATYRLTLAVNDENGDPQDFSDVAEIEMQLRTAYEAEQPSASFTLTGGQFTVPEAGQISLVVSAEDTGEITAGEYVYDLVVSYSGGDVDRVLEGRVFVSPRVTQ